MPVYRHNIQTFPNPPKRFLFIHIPRTAGRFLESNIFLNGFRWEDPLIPPLDGDGNSVELQHLAQGEYERYYNVNNIPHFTIVRNPVDRFISASIFLKRMYGDDIQEAMEDPMMFFSMLQNFPLSESVNWYRPQIDFITDETNIWKFENGFGKDFEEFLSEVLDMEFKVKDVPYSKLDTDETKKLEKSAKLIDNIQSLYKKDFEYLYPDDDYRSSTRMV